MFKKPQSGFFSGSFQKKGKDGLVMTKSVSCNLDDRVVCKNCGKESLVRELKEGDGYSFPIAGEMIKAKYLHCPHCPYDDKNPLIWDTGEKDEKGNKKLLLIHSPMVELRQLTNLVGQ